MLVNPNLLRIPGPTPIPPNIQNSMNHPMINHRGRETHNLLGKVKRDIKPVFGTEQDVIFITGSGTSAMEATVINATSSDDEILVITTGVFGLRFFNICTSYVKKVHHIKVEWGSALNPEIVIDFIKKNPSIKAVFATFCETSTGVLNPINQLGEDIHKYSNALFVVDGVSCVGGVETKVDEWEIDILVTSSQKAMMLPPGLSMITLNERAWKRIENNERPSFYLNLQKYRKDLYFNKTPFTPALPLMLGLEESLSTLKREGLDNVYKRHLILMQMVRKALRSLGVSLLTSDRDASPTVTAFLTEDIDGDAMRQWLKRNFGLELGGGLKDLEGEIIRIGHMGYCAPSDILQIISLIEIGLKHFGKDINLGDGVASAQKFYMENLADDK